MVELVVPDRPIGFHNSLGLTECLTTIDRVMTYRHHSDSVLQTGTIQRDVEERDMPCR